VSAASLPVACSLSTPELRERREGLLAEVRSGALETKRVRGGLALRFPGAARWVETLARLVALERECCRFLRFRLTAEPGGGPVWLEITGPRGTAEFLSVELGLTA
jgi:hypothetical protein